MLGLFRYYTCRQAEIDYPQNILPSFAPPVQLPLPKTEREKIDQNMAQVRDLYTTLSGICAMAKHDLSVLPQENEGTLAGARTRLLTKKTELTEKINTLEEYLAHLTVMLSCGGDDVEKRCPQKSDLRSMKDNEVMEAAFVFLGLSKEEGKEQQ